MLVGFEKLQMCFLFHDHWVLPQELVLVVAGLEGLVQILKLKQKTHQL